MKLGLRYSVGAMAAAATLACGLAFAQDMRWGALSVASDAYGWAKDYQTRKEAEDAALANCRKHSKRNDCDTRAMPKGICGAVVSWDTGSKRFGNIARFAESEVDAKSRALSDCQSRYGGCRHTYSFCN